MAAAKQLVVGANARYYQKNVETSNKLGIQTLHGTVVEGLYNIGYMDNDQTNACFLSHILIVQYTHGLTS